MPTITTTTFASMVPDISAHLPGCPSLVIERTARKIATDLCQRGRVWQLDLTPIAVVAATYEYAMASPVAYAETVDVQDAYFIDADGEKTPVTWKPYAAVRRSHPAWPEADEGLPLYITTVLTGYANLVPVPDVPGTLYVRAYMRPTAAATDLPTWLYNEFQREIFHGTIHELMAMPERSWSSAKMAEYHGRQWTYLLSQATIRAGQEYNTDSQAVQMRPFA